MIALVVRRGCGCVFLMVLATALSCSFLARVYVPDGEPVLGGIAPNARLVVTAQVAPVYADPADDARVVGSLAIGTQVRATGPDTAEWVRVSSLVPDVSGWVRLSEVQLVRLR
jgi:hypothetical protein